MDKSFMEREVEGSTWFSAFVRVFLPVYLGFGVKRFRVKGLVFRVWFRV